MILTGHGDSPLLEKSAIILAGGFSGRLGQDKGLVRLADRPLIKHVLDRTKDLVDESLVIVSSKVQAETYSKVLGGSVNVLVDNCELHSPLAGVVTGFGQARGEYSLLLPCDTPFVSRDILMLLLELCVNKNAAIPRWPNCYAEPLQAVYRTKPALEAGRNALCSGKLNIQAVVDRLQGVRFISTLVLEQLDPGLKTFFNVNSVSDLKRAETMLRCS